MRRLRERVAIGLIAWLAVTAPARSQAEEVSGEAEALVQRALPAGRLRSLHFKRERARVGLELPPGTPLTPVPTEVENLFEELVGWIEAAHPEVKVVDLELARPGEPLQPLPRGHGGSRPSRPPPELPPRPPPVLGPGLAKVSRPMGGAPFGQALAGRTIAVSPGHGYIFYDRLGRYETQRANIKWPGCGTCRGLVEDFGTHALVTRFLIPLLEGAGARVVLLRERSEDPSMTIVDDGAEGFAESGPFQDGSAGGGHEGDYRAGFGAGTSARYRLRSSGRPAWLSTWFVAGANRPRDALVDVLLPGGATVELQLDQTEVGRRWVPLWPIDLPAGAELEVVLSLPAGSPSDAALIADAVRLGGGRHESGHPWAQMGALPFARLQQAPSDITSRVDVGVRPAYAEWFGADAFVSMHSNATGREASSTSGTVTYRYSCQVVSDHAPDPDPSACDDPIGSDRLQAAVHAGLVESLRTDWDPAWNDRGPKAANFGELRLLESIPGVLVETAFHDNVALSAGARMTDNQALQDPRWRRAAAWGVYVGLTRFLAGADAPILAAPPDELTAERLGPGRVELRFSGRPGASAYQVEIADGHGTFRLGPVIEASPARIDVGEDGPVGIRLRSLNSAGLGLPSRIVAVRAGAEPSAVLVVDAFEREDAWVQTIDNRGDTSLIHGLAIEPSGASFDGADEAALRSGRVTLAPYTAIVLALGRESTEHGLLTPGLRAQLRDYVVEGGALYLGGTEVGWALGARGSDESRAFLSEVMGAQYLADDAASRAVKGVGTLAAAFGAALQPLAGEGEGRAEVQFPDVFVAEAGFQAALEYGDGTTAAVASPRTLVVGFGLEHLLRAQDRAALLSGWANLVLGRDPGPARDAGSGVDRRQPDSGEAVVSRDVGTEAEADGGTASSPPPDAGVPAADPRLTAARSDRAPIAGTCGCTSAGRTPMDGAGRYLLIVAGALFVRRRARHQVRDRSLRAGRA